jgi:hypothetical protein
MMHLLEDWARWRAFGISNRFEHPTKTWACATHKQFAMQAVAVTIAKAT